MPSDVRGLAAYVAWIVLIAGAYVLFAHIGFSLAFSVKQITAVWPPTGIAVAALLLGGKRLWPGVLLGAFLANVTGNESAMTAAAIATGNTLGPVLGAYLLRVSLSTARLHAYATLLSSSCLARSSRCP